MKPSAYAALLLGLVSAALGQTLAPSPTESVGCTPHGDHWHCEGPRVTATETGAAVTTTPVLDDHGDHDHDHDEEGHHDHTDHTEGPSSVSLAPSPTESYGCHPHGDHWHCEGPRTALSSGTGVTTLVTTTSAAASSTPDATDGAVSSTSVVPGAAPTNAQAVGLGLAGLVAAAFVAF
ncbi:uncharacterized protein CTHT_0074060 [Thermochaetoides thermophila DSM 1495]|uniref:GPI anchored protein n=1 Tax=Chaetomium thermophilum (strain DSM 1495 / CBS 144.50 / IMI 039719) TaxID=759272 RepID=G0SI08_CHATD|nr:hypothetical protein CTHT_0074060 [Thermochaetoides thermophila DSM 1495]EGS17078.1 hypothetical protein CTHT_0074060 [Thermochaetoides thermophila DSM 1495]